MKLTQNYVKHVRKAREKNAVKSVRKKRKMYFIIQVRDFSVQTRNQ